MNFKERFRNSLFLLIISSFVLFTASCRTEILILSYNVQNLFDDKIQGTEYQEYKKRWNRDLYLQKLEAVARVIKKSSHRDPDIVCLQEIENLAVLKELTNRYLPNMGYIYKAAAPQKLNATGVGILSRFPIVRTHLISPGNWQEYPLRCILEAEIEYNGSILYLFNNHWKSKTGGPAETEKARLKTCSALVKRIREILAENPEADILLAGDLNENVEEYLDTGRSYVTALLPHTAEVLSKQSIYLVDNPGDTGVRDERLMLYETWYELLPNERGSYAYQGEWQTPDHFLLSAGLFDQKHFSYSPGQFRVLRPAFLINEETGFPKRWLLPGFGANAAVQGYSDHLPLLICLEFHQ